MAFLAKKGIIGIIIGFIVLILILVFIAGYVISATKKLPETGEKVLPEQGKQALIGVGILPSERYNITDLKAQELGTLVFKVNDTLTGNYTTNFSKLTEYKVWDTGVRMAIKSVKSYDKLNIAVLPSNLESTLSTKIKYDRTYIYSDNKYSSSAEYYWSAINNTASNLTGEVNDLDVLIINRTSGCRSENCLEEKKVINSAVENLRKVDLAFIIVPSLENCTNFPEINATRSILGINTTTQQCNIGTTSYSCYKNSEDTAFCLVDSSNLLSDISKFITKKAATIELRHDYRLDISEHNITLEVKKVEGLLGPSYHGKKQIEKI
ncbi:MAG: hypothetical protein ACPLYW_01930 [Candidatus Nanoarchaeia archaeon]